MKGPLLTISGLAREAAIAAGPGVTSVAAGGAKLESLARSAISGGATAILSFGIAGGLDPTLRPGTAILATGVVAGSKRWAVNADWRQALSAHLPEALAGDLAGVDAPVLSPAEKQHLAATGALAVDMESHIAARLAAIHRLPFAALRVICDPAGRAIPLAAIAGLRDDGRTDLLAILASLCRRPDQLPALFRLAADARTAFAALARCKQLLPVAALAWPPPGYCG